MNHFLTSNAILSCAKFKIIATLFILLSIKRKLISLTSGHPVINTAPLPSSGLFLTPADRPRIPRWLCPSLVLTAPLSQRPVKLVLLLPCQWPLVSANRSSSSETLKDNLAWVLPVCLSKPRDLKANTRPTVHPRIHLLREEPDTEDRHGGHGERGQQASE